MGREEFEISYISDRAFAEFVEKRMKNSGQAWAMMIIRVVLGVIFLAHGGQKVLGIWGGKGLDATVDGMANMGIPATAAYAAAFTEFIGGIFLIAGILSRFWATGMAVTMVVAIAMVHGQNGFFSQAKGYEYNLALLAMSVAVMLGGPGAMAVADWESKLWSSLMGTDQSRRTGNAH